MSNEIDRAEPSTHGGGGGPDPTGTTESSRGAHRFEERLSAVERALTGSDATVADIGDEAEAAAEREALGERLDDLESRVEELEAATQALRGYAGSIRAVNREVERRADLALARASGGVDTTSREGRDDRLATVHDGRDHAAPAAHDGREDPHRGDADDSAVPSESALDAALPSDPVEDDGIGNDADADDESWGTDALDRLRESL